MTMLAPATSWAAGITVNTTSMALTNDSKCGLREAIVAINTQAAAYGCPKGDGIQDSISLPAGTFTTSEIMQINKPVSIFGAGPSSTIIETSGTYGLYATGGSTARTLSLQSLTLRQSGSVAVSGVDLTSSVWTLSAYNLVVSGYGLNGILSSGKVSLRDSTLENNGASGLLSKGSQADLVRVVVRGNQGTGVRQDNATGGTLNITQCIIENNAGDSGGGIYTNGGAAGKVYVDKTLISSNSAKLGGGLYSEGQFYLTNSTISGNTAETGAGIYHNGAESTMRYMTIVYNAASVNAGGLFVRGGAKTYKYNILADNFAPTNLDIDVPSSNSIASGYNLVGTRGNWTTSATTDIFGVAPNLGSLRTLDGYNAIHPLLEGSPAIDKIPTTASELLTYDQHGRSRPKDGYGKSGSGHDIGAAEMDAVGVLAGAVYTFKPAHASNKCIDIAGGSQANGAKVQLYDCSGNNQAQQFKVIDAGDGYFALQAVVSGKCLDVVNSGTGDGADIQQWTCGTGANQQWYTVQTGPTSSYVKIFSKNSGKVIELDGSEPTSNGSTVQQWTYDGSRDMQWQPVKVL